MTQRDKMRELYHLHRGDEARCVTDYAAAERRGEVSRKRNDSGLDPLEYARALLIDGTRKGWIEQ